MHVACETRHVDEYFGILRFQITFKPLHEPTVLELHRFMKMTIEILVSIPRFPLLMEPGCWGSRHLTFCLVLPRINLVIGFVPRAQAPPMSSQIRHLPIGIVNH